jgi:hypothetical protein
MDLKRMDQRLGCLCLLPKPLFSLLSFYTICESYFIYSAVSPSTFPRFVLNVTGELNLYVWKEDLRQWNLVWKAPPQYCEIFGFCGDLASAISRRYLFVIAQKDLNQSDNMSQLCFHPTYIYINVYLVHSFSFFFCYISFMYFIFKVLVCEFFSLV